MLIGQYKNKISTKGRTALPAKFRHELGEKVVITRWYEGSLAIFDAGAWQKLVEEVVSGGFLTEPARETERFLLAGAYEAELDAQGRFVVPQQLREYAGLADEVVFIGLGQRVEVWGEENWSKKEKEVMEQAGQLAQLLEEARRGR